MKKPFFGFALLVLAFASCKKEIPLPDLTHEGKNIIAWKMDGKVFVSDGSEYFAGENSTCYLKYDTSLIIQGNDRGAKMFIQLGCHYTGLNNPLVMSEKYPFQGEILDFSDPAGGTIPMGSNQYQTDDTHTGTVVVTYLDSTIIAGTFQMDVVNDAGVVKHITEGMFDISRD